MKNMLLECCRVLLSILMSLTIISLWQVDKVILHLQVLYFYASQMFGRQRWKKLISK